MSEKTDEAIRSLNAMLSRGTSYSTAFVVVCVEFNLNRAEQEVVAQMHAAQLAV